MSKHHAGPPGPLKGICYGSDPVGISLQLTNFQSLIGLRMNHIVFREDPKFHLPVSRTCTFFKYTITANGKNDISEKKIHFLYRLAFLLLHIISSGITLPCGIVKFYPTFQQACSCTCRPVKMTISIFFLRALSEDPILSFPISLTSENQLIEHDINKT